MSDRTAMTSVPANESSTTTTTTILAIHRTWQTHADSKLCVTNLAQIAAHYLERGAVVALQRGELPGRVKFSLRA
jgi:hypothetical protein